MKLVQRSILGVACMAALLACNRRSVDRDGNEARDYDDRSGGSDKSGAPAPGERVGVTTVTGADLSGLSNEIAVERIVAARCARETACNNIGSDKHFVDRDVCTRELRSRIGADLRASECPRGIDASALDKCMDSIKSESCNNPIDTIQRLAACRTADMCMKTAESR